ncbi:MAG: hypothetical protein ACOX4R_04940 [Lentihominibacter sp.]|jgi:hypothetical protein
MTERAAELIGDIAMFIVIGGIALAVLIGIIMRIYERIKYGREESSEDPEITPLHHYGAMPVKNMPFKYDFSYDEEQEEAVAENENKREME